MTGVSTPPPAAAGSMVLPGGTAAPDGLALPREIAARAVRMLRPGGVLLMEHADSQGESLPLALRAVGFVDVADHADLVGRPRVASGARGQSPVA